MKNEIKPAPIPNTYGEFLQGDAEDRDMDKEDARLEEERRNAKPRPPRDMPPYLP